MERPFHLCGLMGPWDANKYKGILMHKVLLTLDATYGAENWVCTQDGAPSHTTDKVQAYLEQKLGSKGF